MRPKYATGERVCCLVTRFDDELDAQGRLFSQIHFAKEKYRWCFGAVSRVLGGRNFNRVYNVKWDGDSKQYKSHEEHLKSVDGMMDDGESEYEDEDGAEEEASDVEAQMEDEGRDPEADMDDADPEEDRGDESADERYPPFFLCGVSLGLYLSVHE